MDGLRERFDAVKARVEETPRDRELPQDVMVEAITVSRLVDTRMSELRKMQEWFLHAGLPGELHHDTIKGKHPPAS